MFGIENRGGRGPRVVRIAPIVVLYSRLYSLSYPLIASPQWLPRADKRDYQQQILKPKCFFRFSLTLSLSYFHSSTARKRHLRLTETIYSDRGATLWWTDDRRHVPLDSWIARYRCSTKRRSHGRANNRRHRVYACALSSDPAGDRGTMRDPSYILTFWQMAGGSRALYFQTLVRRGGTRCVLETVSAFARKTDASHSFMEGLRKRGERKFYRDEYACTFY